MPRVAFYTRISTDEDHQKYSLDAQRDRLEAFCRSQYDSGWSLHKIYRDSASATHMDRPGLEEMLYDASVRAFDVLLVFRVDRLSRKVRELALIVDELTKLNVVLRSITEPFDTANPAGKMMLQMLGVFAEFEHATIIERTKVGMEKKARGGAFVGGHVPYGFRLQPDQGLVPCEEEAFIVRKMFSMYALGKEGSQAIALKLNESGCRKRSGKKWDGRVILNILRNPAYIGKVRWREVVYEGNHEPIVSETVFAQAQGLLDQRQEAVSGRRWNNGKRLLAGITRCARCGNRMVGISTKKPNISIPYYVCTKRHSVHDCDQDYVRADLLEASIVEDIQSLLQAEDLMASIRGEANKRLASEMPDLTKDIGRVESQAADVRGRIDRYLEAFESGRLEPEACSQKVWDLKARLEELHVERDTLVERRERLSLAELDPEFLRQTLGTFEKVIAMADAPMRKHLLQLVVKKVVVHDRHSAEAWFGVPAPEAFRGA